MPKVGSKKEVCLRRIADQGWWFDSWAAPSVAAGISDRSTQRSALLAHAGARIAVESEQVHGASIAVVDNLSPALQQPIAGCDALITRCPETALLIRTADCLPIFFAHRKQGVVALAHAGWRGLAKQLPVRVLAAFWDQYRCSAGEVEVAIGPAIRSCCYAVGFEFEAIFGAFVNSRRGKRTCDLIGVATSQLQQAGVARSNISDSGLCTACGVDRWFSLRREAQAAERLTSLIMHK